MTLEDYYRRRAKEYDEQIYCRTDLLRQNELEQIGNAMKEKLKGRRVLELACGPGYWTRILSDVALDIVATDAVREMVDIAKTKNFNCSTSFVLNDAYQTSFQNGSFEGGMANFWFSHVPKSRIHTFLAEFHRVLQNKSRVFMVDNVYVPGIGGQLVAKKGDENTYKLRTAGDGSKDLVLKNYYQADELVKIFSHYVEGFAEKNVFCGNYFWFVAYDVQ